MRVVVDGLAIRGENSLSIVSEHLLSGWQRIGAEDEVHLVVRADAGIAVPESVAVHVVDAGGGGAAGRGAGRRVATQSVLLPRLCRALDADVVLAMLPATALTPLPCPRAVIAWDFRYRVLPRQFGPTSLLVRRVSHGIGYRQADAVACISERTKADLLRFHPGVARRPVRVAHLGADHVDAWPVRTPREGYAIAFGHFANKNVHLVLGAWSALCVREAAPLPLRLVGVPARQQAALEARVAQLGLADVVSVRPWLTAQQFREEFASSSLVVFPSDFEGFGLPALEAMRLGIPVVITPEPALLEVTAGHATVVDGTGPAALAGAVERALRVPAESLRAARRHADGFTWANFASGVRSLLAEASGQPGPTAVREGAGGGTSASTATAVSAPAGGEG